jgi:photosystem II stability/assembly factor-like uncharacterized protein
LEKYYYQEGQVYTFLLSALLFFLSLFSFPATAVANPIQLAAGGVNGHAVISVSTDFGKHWKDKSLKGPDVDLVKCTADANTCIAASSRYNPTHDAGIYRGTNKGLEWTRIHLNFSDKEPNYTGIGCTGADKSTTCFIAAGSDHFDTPPTIWVSTDTGLTWAIPPIVDLPKKGRLGTAACTDGEADAVCVIAGSGFMLVSSDGGRNWSVKNLPSTVSNYNLEKISCTGHGANAICTAIDFYKPLIVVTQDGGNTWITTHIKSVNGATFSGVSCTGEAPTAVCVVTGSSFDTPKKDSMTPFLAVSEDNANNFIVNPSSILQFNGNMGEVSCVGNGSNAVCEAIGEIRTGSFLGDNSFFLVRSKNGANTWTQQTLPKKYWLGKKYTYSLRHIDCQYVDSNVACVVFADAHSYSHSPLPAVFTTNDIDSDWNIYHWSPCLGTIVGMPGPVWAEYGSVKMIAGA